jgi:phenylalanyl-tRNA synthetase alpha chain
MPQQISELILKFESVDDVQALKLIWAVDDIAGRELGKHLFEPAFRECMQRWYGHYGYIWDVLNALHRRWPNLATWAQAPVRDLLKTPAKKIFSQSVLEREAKDRDWTASQENVNRWFGALETFLSTVLQAAVTQWQLELVEQIWTNRGGIKNDVSEEWMTKASPSTRKYLGLALKNLSETVERILANQKLIVREWSGSLESVDLSLPGVLRPIGSHHLIRQVFQDVEDIFVSIGFSVVEGPEIETPYYNFEALNIPEFHPVRDDMDTFYIDLPKGAPTPLLLRTHTSPMQIRTMEKQKPPVRVIVPGKVYRRDNPDATHSFAFHQVEGLAVDTDITFCNFTGTIEYFVKQFFGPGVKTRFRPSYFPFTEPSVEFDVSCIFCGGSGTASSGATCGKCKGAGWIELFGAGMVDPAVYGFVNYDAKKVNGFAFGMGMDRLAMLKYGIDDIQVFFQNDVRFLRQFP